MSLVTTAVEEESNQGRHVVPAIRLAGNPVSDRAQLSYELERGGPVSCVVYDAAGHKVAELCDGIRGPGQHTLTWDAGSAAPGVYFVELVTPSGVRTARLVKAR